MAKITFKGNPVATIGDLPKAGAPAPDFTLVKNDLGTVSRKDFAGKNVVLNIFPGIFPLIALRTISSLGNGDSAKILLIIGLYLCTFALIEVPLIAGHYLMIAYAVNSFGTPVPDGSAALPSA